MESVILFFCDIVGTFDRLNTSKDILRFVDNLEKLRSINNSNKVIFSFISTDNVEVVNQMINRLSKYIINKDIELGKQFYSKGNETINKPFSIFDYTVYLSNKYSIKGVYYADDALFYHEIVQELKDIYDVNIPIHSIITTDKNINLLIEDSFKEKSRNK